MIYNYILFWINSRHNYVDYFPGEYYNRVLKASYTNTNTRFFYYKILKKQEKLFCYQGIANQEIV